MFLICKMGIVVVAADLIGTNKHIKYLEKTSGFCHQKFAIIILLKRSSSNQAIIYWWLRW